MDALDQAEIDQALIDLDGTPTKSKLGANALLAVSLATARAAADYLEIPLYKYLGGPNARTLPVPMMNIINGGAHADNNVDFQEFMIVPVGATTFREACESARRFFTRSKSVLKKKGYATSVGDEGGFAPTCAQMRRRSKRYSRRLRRPDTPPARIACWLSIRRPASFTTASRTYSRRATSESCRAMRWLAYWKSWAEQYPIISIEDGMAENDWDGWKTLTDELGQHVQLVGDDLFVTNTEFLRKGIELGVANSILIKVNQIGTLTETLDCIELAKTHGANGSNLSSLRRDRRSLHCRPGSRDKRRPDQDRFAIAHRSDRQIQSTAAHRGRLARSGALPGSRCVLSASENTAGRQQPDEKGAGGEKIDDGDVAMAGTLG